MNKFFFATIVSFVCATASFAQTNNTSGRKVGFSVGLELASPVGDFNKTHNFGLGGTAQIEYMTSEKTGVTLNAGSTGYSGKTVGAFKYQSVTQIPVLVGIRYYFIKDIYLSGQTGVSFFNRNIGSAFTLAPGIGVKVSIIDLTLKYMGTFKSGSSPDNVSLRVAVSF